MGGDAGDIRTRAILDVYARPARERGGESDTLRRRMMASVVRRARSDFVRWMRRRRSSWTPRGKCLASRASRHHRRAREQDGPAERHCWRGEFVRYRSRRQHGQPPGQVGTANAKNNVNGNPLSCMFSRENVVNY